MRFLVNSKLPETGVSLLNECNSHQPVFLCKKKISDLDFVVANVSSPAALFGKSYHSNHLFCSTTPVIALIAFTSPTGMN